MTDQNQQYSGPPPSYEEVQAMSGGAPYPLQPPYPQQQGFKYDGYGAPPYPTQQGGGPMPYPQQLSYPYNQGVPNTYPYGDPGQPAPPPPGSASYNPQGGVILNGRNPASLLGMNDMQRRRRVFIFIFVFIAICLFIYFLTRIIL